MTAQPEPVDVLAVHPMSACKKDARTIDFHVKSYSFEFACPRCGKRRRMNTNYLGGRRLLLCDGTRIKPSARLSWDDYRAMATGGAQP